MDDLIEEAIDHLSKGDHIIYPTETLWALGCDATNESAIESVNAIKGRRENKGYVLVVEGVEMLANYVGHITPTIRSIAASDTPTTVVFSEHQGLPGEVLAPDGSVAIRITQNKFCKKLIQGFGKPLVSTSANFSGDPVPQSFGEIDTELKNAVDYVVELDDPGPMTLKASRIVKLSPGGGIEMIR